MSLSTFKDCFVVVDDLITIDNIGHGICLPCAFFQGYNLARGNGRVVESDLRKQIGEAMIKLIRALDVYDPSSLSTKSKIVIKEWEKENIANLIKEEAVSLPSQQYWNAEILEYYIANCLCGTVELYYFKMV